MTRFEQIGCQLQQDSETIREARRRMNYSCQVCCSRGMRIECDRCAIQCVHQQTVAILRDIEPVLSGLRSAC